jgi:hypothetical protein
MWHKFRNWIASLRTYNVMSPDLCMRRRVNRMLAQRPLLTEADWFEVCCKPLGISYSIAAFLYKHLPQYSGLDIGRVGLSDRLEADLHWTQVCWFDWQITLCQDFDQVFAVDISEVFDECQITTIEDLLIFLDQQCRQDVVG